MRVRTEPPFVQGPRRICVAVGYRVQWWNAFHSYPAWRSQLPSGRPWRCVHASA